VDGSGRHLTPAGNRGKVETPQGKPEEGQLPHPRKGTLTVRIAVAKLSFQYNRYMLPLS
jgi:hypothetical protein